jgi:hypothetical protein
VIKKQDYIIHERPKLAVDGSGCVARNGQTLPLTGGLWQHEALDTLGMYAPDEGNFTPVKGEQLSLFPMEPVARAASLEKLDLDDAKLCVPHQDSFRFLAKDTQRQIRSRAFYEAAAQLAPAKHVDAVTATRGELLVDGITELKADQFPGRVQYTEGGLYTKDPTRKKNEKVSPELVEEHHHAPNYRKMENKPVHGVGQPTKKGFRDVLDHLGGKDKPVVWTNTRGEAIIYIDGEPYNLREVASRENLDLKTGATGAEVEELEKQLKERLIAKAKANGNMIRVPLETPGPDGKSYKDIPVTASNVQTTKEVIEELQGPPNNYKVEYRRIPMTDEKSPTPAQIDEVRNFMNEVQARHPKEKDKLEYVFNCHQGRGRTTTGMVAGAIALDGLDGKTVQLELPFGVKIGENAGHRADRLIDEAFHMQNLRESVEETKKKAANAEKDAQKYELKAAGARTDKDRQDNEKLARSAHQAAEKYQRNAADFTKRYAMMQKYSEYIDKFGAHNTTTSFDDWMKQSAQTEDLDKKWLALNEQLGLDHPNSLQPALAGRSDVALA